MTAGALHQLRGALAGRIRIPLDVLKTFWFGAESRIVFAVRAVPYGLGLKSRLESC